MSVTPPRPARRADPRSAAAALLSFCFPGIGQAYNGQWGLASLLAVPVVLLIGLAILVIAQGRSEVLSRLLDARVLVALIVLDVALLGWRLVAILQAHVARSRLRAPAWTTWATAMLVVVTIAMHALPAWYAAKAIDTLGTVALEGGGALFDRPRGSGRRHPGAVVPAGDRARRAGHRPPRRHRLRARPRRAPHRHDARRHASIPTTARWR